MIHYFLSMHFSFYSLDGGEVFGASKFAGIIYWSAFLTLDKRGKKMTFGSALHSSLVSAPLNCLFPFDPGERHENKATRSLLEITK